MSDRPRSATEPKASSPGAQSPDSPTRQSAVRRQADTARGLAPPSRATPRSEREPLLPDPQSRLGRGVRAPRDGERQPPSVHGPASTGAQVRRARGSLPALTEPNEDSMLALRPTSSGHPRSDEQDERASPGRLSDTIAESARTRASEADADDALADSSTNHAADPLIGMVIADRYRILERIGRGGMGIVYRVEHARIGKLLAMKLLAGELSQNKEVVRRFKVEALTVSKLSNPNTVQVFDYGVWQHLTFLVMELAEGIDLSRTVKRQGPLPFSRLGRLMLHVCASLNEAHAKGIVHRDIKPENIMVVTNGAGKERAKVLDFGLAKLREGSDLNEVTQQGAVVGTPYYMSPEQVLGEEVDERTDIYSLGAVMYRALTGDFPFHATTPMAMITKHLTAPPPSAAELHPELDIPLGVSSVIVRCMQKNKADRFQRIAELREQLERELGALGVPTRTGALDVQVRAEALAASEPAAQARGPAAKIATRDEIEAYETRLRRNRYGLWAFLAAGLLTVAAGVGYTLRRPGKGFQGTEIEPNDAASDATRVPTGSAVSGHIGRRVDASNGDVDFYRFEFAGDDPVTARLHVDSLPNFGLCASLYKVGFAQPIAQYCSGAQGGQPILVPALRLDPGSYFVALMQDRNAAPGGRGGAPVHENVSDPYRITFAETRPSDTSEREPNDAIEQAQTLAANDELEGTLGFASDEDVVCAGRAKPGTRFVVEDGRRRFGTVLEVTPIVDGTPHPIARIHGATAQPLGRARVDADVNAPFTTPPCTGQRCCLRMRLVRDPWIDPETATGPLPDETPYRVKLSE